MGEWVGTWENGTDTGETLRFGEFLLSRIFCPVLVAICKYVWYNIVMRLKDGGYKVFSQGKLIRRETATPETLELLKGLYHD